jgi:hypothetical protein
LVHSEESYRHKLLIVAEQSGVDSEYQDCLFRTLLSEGKIKYSVTEKVDGRFVVTEKEKEGPTGLITSTTRAKLHPENETRILSIHMTDTREQTRAVVRAQASNSKREMETEPWKKYATWLAGQDNRVWISYSEVLAGLIEVYDVRQRRDITLLLNTIKTLAIMHQAKRERDHPGRIVASLRDYEMARELLNDLLSEGIGATVSETIRQTVGAVKALATNDETINSSAVAKHLNLDKGSVSDRIRNVLVEGYIVNLQDPGKRGHKLALGSDLPEDSLLLPEPHELLNATLCNIVRQFGWFRGWTTTIADLPNIVRLMVRPDTRTAPTVPVSGKPYDPREVEKTAYISHKTADPSHESSVEISEPPILPKPAELTNYVTSTPENVTIDDDSGDRERTAEPSHRTNVSPALSRERMKLLADDVIEAYEDGMFWGELTRDKVRDYHRLSLEELDAVMEELAGRVAE